MRQLNFGKGFQAFDVVAAATLLTRLPLPIDHARAGARAAAAAWAFPLVGLALGAAAGAVLAGLAALGAGANLSAALALAFLALATGAMHEDGLGDCADGLGGGRDKAHALEIMRDSRIGSYAALAIGLALLARWSGMAELAGWQAIPALAAVGATSRAAMVAAMALLPPARTDGLAASAGVASRDAMLLAAGIAAVACLTLLGTRGIVVFLLAPLAAAPLLWLARRKLGGQTGDVLGATQQCAEIGALLALSLTWH